MSVSEGGRVFLRPILIYAIEGTAQTRDRPFSAYSFVARQKSMAECGAATPTLIYDRKKLKNKSKEAGVFKKINL